MNRSPSKNSFLDVMDPWFSADPRPPAAVSQETYAHVDEYPGAHVDDSYSARQESDHVDSYYQSNAELRDFAQYTGNYRFTHDAHVGALGEGREVTSSDYEYGHVAVEEGGNHFGAVDQVNYSVDNGDSSIMGLADSEGNGFEYDSTSLRAASIHTVDLGRDGSGPTHHRNRSGSGSGSGSGGFGFGGVGVEGESHPVPMGRGKDRRYARETLKEITEELHNSVDQKGSSVISTLGNTGSLDRLCTIEELWQCSPHWPCEKDKVFKAVERRLFDIDVFDSKGKTALMNACILEKESVIWFLLSNGARVDIQNEYGYSALMWCCIYGRKVGVQLLLEAGATQDLCRRDGKTAREMANHFITGFPIIVKILDEYQKKKGK